MTWSPPLRVNSYATHLLDLAFRLGFETQGVHLAILIEPFFTMLLTGSKTVESRWTNVKCAPHFQVEQGDCVFVKKPGGPVTHYFVAGWTLTDNPQLWHMPTVILDYGNRIGTLAEEVWTEWATKRYATLIEVTRVVALPRRLVIDKKDKRGWVVLRGRCPCHQ